MNSKAWPEVGGRARTSARDVEGVLVEVPFVVVPGAGATSAAGDLDPATRRLPRGRRMPLAPFQFDSPSHEAEVATISLASDFIS